MANSLIGSKEHNVSLTTNSFTGYYSVCSGGLPFGTVENNYKHRVGKAVTLSKFGLHINSNARSTNTIFRLRKNGANGNSIITVGSGASGFFEDASNTDSISAGDDINGSVTTSTGGGAIVVDGVRAALATASGGFCTFFTCTPNSIAPSFSTNSARFYNALSGALGINYSTTEADKQVIVRCSGVFRRMFLTVASNTRITNTVFSFRKNGADGSQSITVSGGATGFFEDASNSDSVASGDLICYSGLTSTGGGSIGVFPWGSTYDGNDNQHDMYALHNSSVQRIASSTDIFPSWFGYLSVGNTVENQGKTRFPFDARLDRLRVKVFNNNTNPITYRLRKNGADGNQAITINAGGSGLFEDSSSVDDVVAGDDVNFKGSSATNTGSYAYMALRINEPFVPASGGGNRRVCIMQ